jgi:RNA polymerase sigma factor (TIGR02999 family)
MREIMSLLGRVQQGDPQAATELLPLVYDELRRLAAHKMAREPAGHTLQATALVHEAWLRVAGEANPQFQGRGHFFAAAAEAMRRILVERARRKQRLRHGGGQERVPLDPCDIPAPASEDRILLVHEALETLEAEDMLQAQVVKLRFFAGFNNAETAQALDLSEKTVQRYWTHAKAQLFQLVRSRV